MDQNYFPKNILRSRRTAGDGIFLCLFVILVTYNPFYLWGKLNLFELGLYLPAIEGVLKGLIPYRDFFYLRGPFEIYLPALLMKVFGLQVSVLATYFYVGTVVTFIIVLLLAMELIDSKFILYLFVPVLIARTFPRVVFTYWGGIRYGLGLLAVWCVVKFIKSGRPHWMFAAGIVSAVCLLTSVEVGVCALAGVGMALVLLAASGNWRSAIWAGKYFIAGLAVLTVPYLVYLQVNGALLPFWEATAAVVFKSHPTFATYLTSKNSPKNFPQFLLALCPGSHSFKYMTPFYLYLIVFVRGVIRWRRRTWSSTDLALASVGAYGAVMYATAFRIIEGAQFEMALQPEKILLFFLLGEGLGWLANNGGNLPQGLARFFPSDGKRKELWVRNLAGALTVFLISGSLLFFLDRMNKRFFISKAASCVLRGKGLAEARPFPLNEVRQPRVQRCQGLMVPLEQADQIEGVVREVQSATRPNEAVLFYPDMAAYGFLTERPWVGRFPVVFFTWMEECWHLDLLAKLSSVLPRVVVVERQLPPDFQNVYFTVPQNRQKFLDIMAYVQQHYFLAAHAGEMNIYRLKSAGPAF